MSRFLEDWGPTLVSAAGVTVVAVAGAVLTEIGPWYRALKKPSWQPPDWVFGPVWTSIFILEATAGVISWHALKFSGPLYLLIALFFINGGLNVYWSYLFFKKHRPDQAQAEVPFLWLSILAPIIALYIYVGWAWVLLLPYLIWVSIAAYLNYTIVRMNAPFTGAA
jgi:tryptophan-rich sensory protein